MSKELTKQLQQNAMLYALESLPDEEVRAFETVLKSNPALQKYLEEIRSTLELTETGLNISFETSYLEGQRNLLKGRIIQLEQERKHPLSRIMEEIGRGFRSVFQPRQPAWAVVTYVVIAFLLGQVIPSRIPRQNTRQTFQSSQEILDLIQEGGLTRVDLQPGDNNGKLEMALETKGSIDISGDFKDETVQQILYYLILNDSNPGKRLRALKLLTKVPDLDNKKLVLISTVLSDPNSGIRLKALEQLSAFQPDKTIMEACTKLLLEDKNEAVRMGALAILGKAPTGEIVPVLRVVSLMDENPYIRDRASEILDEVTEMPQTEKIEVTQ